MGRRIAERLGASIHQAPLKCSSIKLGGELALFGLGSLAVERWGMALVIAMQGATGGKTGTALVSSVVSGALQRTMSRDTAVIELAQSDETLRLLVISKFAAPQVRQWLSENVTWGDVITRLHQQRGDA